MYKRRFVVKKSEKNLEDEVSEIQRDLKYVREAIDYLESDCFKFLKNYWQDRGIEFDKKLLNFESMSEKEILITLATRKEILENLTLKENFLSEQKILENRLADKSKL